MYIRRLLGVSMVVALALGAAGCDPAPPPGPGEASITVDIEPGGEGQAIVNTSVEDRDVVAAAEAVGHALFGGRDWRADIESNGAGHDLGVVHVAGLYERTASPSVKIDTERLLPSLAPFGIDTIRLTVCPPPKIEATFSAAPPAEIDRCASTIIRPQAEPVILTITLHLGSADPWPLVIRTLIGLVAVVGGAILISVRRPRTNRSYQVSTGIALVAIASGLIAVRFMGEADDPALPFHFPGWVATYTRIAPGAAIAAIILGLCILGFSATRLRRPIEFFDPTRRKRHRIERSFPFD
jgi:hypothetical protein